MKIESFGTRTNLMFAAFSGSVVDKGAYTVVQTPNNPGYHWGNYLIFDRPPQKGDWQAWTSLFQKEFPYYEKPQHYVFAWEGENLGDHQEFLAKNFAVDSAVVLTTNVLQLPTHFHSSLEVRPLTTDGDWQAAVDLQNLCADDKYMNTYYLEFKTQQMANYRKMSDAGRGHWFGAFLGGKMVGDLGIFHETELARYQSVGTHPDYRRQGICATLVYQAGKFALEKFAVKHLVMEADPEYHAARVYESVGFQRNETNYALSWWESKK